MITATKEEAFDLLEAAREEWLAAARFRIKAFAKTGTAVTVNDVRNLGPELPDGVDGRVYGAVFMERGVWENLGYTKSTRRVSHCRPVCQFRLVGTA